jgi:peptidoglycan-associated lipoprotein
MNRSLLFVLAAMAVGLAACKSADTLPDSSPSADFGNGVNTTGNSGGDRVTVSPLEAEREAERLRLLGTLVVYFDYDQADIRPEFNSMLQAHGQFLAQNANAQLRLEGHADERGSREYNIGLGERRAQAVRRVLSLQGAQPAQLTTISYGEERPAATGSDEESWRLNRRVELNYTRR